MSASPLIARSPHNAFADSYPNFPVMSMRATALEVCYSVYGENPTDVDAVDRFYDANAGDYENPLITATSRGIISDIHRLARQLSTIDVPRPLALIYTLFGVRQPKTEVNTPLFQALRVWNEIGDICECEMFDGHRKTIVEHTLNVLPFPGMHHDGLHRHQSNGSTDSLVNAATGSPIVGLPLPHMTHFALPSLPVPCTSLSLPSPLHFKLRILTSLSFNEQGFVTHHHDYWDARDLLGLVPGVSLAQWIMSRLAAMGLSYTAKLLLHPKELSYASDDSWPVSSPLRFGVLPTNTLGLDV